MEQERLGQTVPSCQCRHQKVGRNVFLNGINLLPRDTGKPLQKIVNRSASLNILKQSAHGNTRPLENPRATDLAGFSFHSRTVVPICMHNVIAPQGGARFNLFF